MFVHILLQIMCIVKRPMKHLTFSLPDRDNPGNPGRFLITHGEMTRFPKDLLGLKVLHGQFRIPEHAVAARFPAVPDGNLDPPVCGSAGACPVFRDSPS